MSPLNVDEDPLRSKIHILIDPVNEMFASLHVLADSSHHLSNQDWSTTTLAAMSAELREEIAYFGQHFDEWLSIADVIQFINEFGIAVPTFLERLATLPPLEVVNVILNSTGITNIPGYPVASHVYEPATIAAHQAAQSHPVAFIARLLQVLQIYWTDYFRAEWERRYPLLDSRRALEASRLDTSSPTAWLPTLHDRISYEAATDQLIFHKQQDLCFALEQLERIDCVPSTFIVPHLMVGYMQRRLVISINVAPVVFSTERIPAELLDVAKALADETRLRIFKSVLRRPHYTQELALSMGLAEPTVSRHLKILKAAKLVRSSKEGAFVQYSGLLDPVDRLPAVLREYLRG